MRNYIEILNEIKSGYIADYNECADCNNCSDKSLCFDLSAIQALDAAIKTLEQESTAEPKPSKEKGKWYIREYEFFTCDQCGEDVLSHAECTSEAKRKLADGDFPNFCENCGADMRGDEE